MSDRPVATDALETLGTIISETEKRDAIHLAVEPIIAGEDLEPGTHVGIKDGKAYAKRNRYSPVENSVGIVDPFLKRHVKEGDRFWLVVYPRQITSLRHVWSHPEFPETAETQKLTTSMKAESEAWLRNFAREQGPSYEEFLANARDYSEYMCFGTDIYGDIPEEFWHHCQIILGKEIPKDKRAEYFRCAC